MAIKKEVFEARRHRETGAILASNTSYLDIDEIASVTKRPEFVIGMHFPPANVMRSSRWCAATGRRNPSSPHAARAPDRQDRRARRRLLRLRGQPMLAPRQREANKLILEGAMPWDVDRSSPISDPMGPFAMADLAGLDIGWSRETSKGETVREILCERDRRGQKTGAASTTTTRTATRSPRRTSQVILDLSSRHGIARRAIPDEEILERCIYTMINEGAKILEEGKAQRVGHRYRLDQRLRLAGLSRRTDVPRRPAGLRHVRDRLEHYEAQRGPDFKPAALLERLVAEGKSFRDL